MIRILKRLTCSHEYEWYRNIYGDEINWSGGARSDWKCRKCGKLQFRDYLMPLMSTEWDCPRSPDGTCHYQSDQDEHGGRCVTMRSGANVPLPIDHCFKDETEDSCIFCGEPYERK